MFAPSEKLAAGQYIEGALNLDQHNYFRKFVADFSLEMARSVSEMLKNWR